MSNASVALCTYNGGRFLREQLQSIADQSARPAELVICDDGSTDDTVSIAETFARSAPFRVDVHRNRTRSGTIANFDYAMSLCGGDVIFLCDQDDVWHPEKIARTIRRFDDARVQCIFTRKLRSGGRAAHYRSRAALPQPPHANPRRERRPRRLPRQAST